MRQSTQKCREKTSQKQQMAQITLHLDILPRVSYRGMFLISTSARAETRVSLLLTGMKSMGRIVIVLLAGCFITVAAASPKVSSSAVHYTSGKDSVSAYLSIPSGKGPFPAIIVIHEWWGLNDWVKESARQLSSEGYVTLAVDLYRGKVASDPELAHELMRGLPEDRAARDLVSAAAYLKTRTEVNQKKIGSIGWCMGGGYSLAAALNIPDLSACIICYGRLVTDSSSIARIPCPVLGLFGQEDQGIPPQSVREFEADARRLGKDVSVSIYPGAGHAFMNRNNRNKPGYQPTASKDAWSRISTFFQRTLKQ
jgi:carboxymethylenebutenolidase